MHMAEVVLHFCSGFAFGQPRDTLCFLMHTGRHTNCGSSFTYVRYAYAWSMLKGCLCVYMCTHVCMRKKTLCIDEHITLNPTSIFLFS